METLVESNCYNLDKEYFGTFTHITTETSTENYGRSTKDYKVANFVDNYGRHRTIEESQCSRLTKTICKPRERYLDRLLEFRNYGINPSGKALMEGEKYYYEKKLWKVSKAKSYRPPTGSSTVNYTLERVDKTNVEPNTLTFSHHDPICKQLVSEEIVKQYEEVYRGLSETIQNEIKLNAEINADIDNKISDITKKFYFVSSVKAEDIDRLKREKESLKESFDRAMEFYNREIVKVAAHHPLRFQKEMMEKERSGFGGVTGGVTGGGINSSSSNSAAATTATATATATATRVPSYPTIAVRPTPPSNSSAAASYPTMAVRPGPTSNIPSNNLTGNENKTNLSGGRRRGQRKSRKTRKARKARKGKKQSRRRV